MESALPEVIPPSLFGLTEFNPEVHVSLIRCGLSHFAALTSKWPSGMEVFTKRCQITKPQNTRDSAGVWLLCLSPFCCSFGLPLRR